ncbi:MAG TPA: matrixin family metalloprotease [Candidatus Obscuribacter sp.]|nr:matrixin family metalloprotease [Candidatus Obscuribacter sp.]
MPNFRKIAVGLALHLTIVVLVGGPAMAQAGYEKEKATYEACQKASSLIANRQFDEASNILNLAAKNDPTSYSGYLHRQLSTCYRNTRHYSNAIAEIKTASKYDPAYKRTDYDTAMIYYDEGKLEQAVAGLEAAKNSSDADISADARKLLKEVGAYGNLQAATKSIEKGKLKEAKKQLLQAAAYDPSPYSGSIHANLSFALRGTGEPEKAIIEAKKALAIDPKDKYTLYTLALAYQDIGDFRESIKWLRAYAQVETDPKDRQQALTYLQELTDDLGKQSPGDNDKPDYMEQLKTQQHTASWPASKMPLKIYIKPAAGVKGFKSNFNSFVVHSMDTWCSICPKISYKIVDNPSKADIKVVWTSEPLTLNENGRIRQKAGLTDVKRTGDDNIIDALVRIRTINAFADSPIEDGECASVTMHELGHALGLGHSTNVCDIMYFGSSSKQTGMPTGRDSRTIAKLYKEQPLLVATAKIPIKPLAIEYLPPPAFLPPKPKDTSNLPPPIFMPPPLTKEAQKLKPPIFMPPPLRAAAQSPKSNGQEENQRREGKTPMPFFLPPPK